ncbi:MAG: sugar phosphate isomerase/epimerase family protein [Thermoprotei archaeon]
MTKIYFGINNCWAVKRWPLPEEWAEIYRKLDVEEVQFSFDLLDPRTNPNVLEYEAALIKDTAKKYGLKIHSTFTGLAAYSYNLLGHPDPALRADGLDWYLSALKVTHLMDVPMTGGHIAAKSVRQQSDASLRDEAQRGVIEAVNVIRRRAASLGLQALLWEPMPVPRETPWSIKEANETLKISNEGYGVPVRLAIDVGHQCTLQGPDGDPYVWLAQLGSYSPVVHLQQTDGKADRHWPFSPDFNSIGIIKPDKVISSLEKSGANEVHAFIEYIPPFEENDDNVLRNLEDTVKYWKDYI